MSFRASFSSSSAHKYVPRIKRASADVLDPKYSKVFQMWNMKKVKKIKRLHSFKLAAKAQPVQAIQPGAHQQQTWMTENNLATKQT